MDFLKNFSSMGLKVSQLAAYYTTPIVLPLEINSL